MNINLQSIDMELNDYYNFDEKLLEVTVQVRRTQKWDWPCPPDTRAWIGEIELKGLYPLYQLLMGDYRGIPLPLEFRHDCGKRYDDVIRTGFISLYLISDRFREVLEKNHFTGWKCFPVRILTKKGEEVHGYQGLSVTGRAGIIHWERSEVIQDEYSSYYRRIHLDREEWDGSDFFLAKDYWGIFVTKRVKEALLEAKLTNVVFNEVSKTKKTKKDVPK